MSARQPGDDGSDSLNLGSGSDWVDGSSVNWVELASYIATIAVLIVAETWSRFLSGVFELPRRLVATATSVYTDLAETSIGAWPSLFAESFDAAGASAGDLGVLGFLSAIVFVIVWYLVLSEIFEVI